MSLTIKAVQIVDDDPNVREAYMEDVRDLDIHPVSIDGPIDDLDRFMKRLNAHDAVLCDYHLKKGSYAPFNGAEMVVKLYQARIPSILCTRFEPTPSEIRHFRRYIPVLLAPDELSPQRLDQGFRQCLEEFKDHYLPSRRPWRTLIRVEDIDEEQSHFSVIIPGWDAHKVITRSLDSIPVKVKELLDKQIRFYAQVNTGADEEDELYFEDWEID